MSDTPNSIDDLSPQKRALFELLLKEKRSKSPPSTQAIPRRQSNEAIPLSFAQQRLWFLDQLEPGNPAYNIFEPLRLIGPLNIAVLQRSLNEIARRHEIVRTTYTTIDGQPVQVIAAEMQIGLAVIDLQHLSEAERETELKHLLHAETQQGFDLAKGPLIRGKLIRLAAEEHVLCITLHHSITDAWSWGVLVHELATLYEALLNDRPLPLAELPIQYADFAVWQRQWLQGDVLKTQLDYWKQHLGDAPALLELPTDRQRPPAQTFQGRTHARFLPAPLTSKIMALSRREGVTLFMTLLSAWQALLARYSGQTDISVGTPIANRGRAELEGLIGFFLNTLVLRTDLSGNPSFRQLVQRVREVTLGAFAHQDLPFEKLVEELQPDRNVSHHPLFQVAFVLQNAPIAPQIEDAKLHFEPLVVDGNNARHDLHLYIGDLDDGLITALEYNIDLFDDDSIQRMLEHFQILLEAIVENPDQSINNIPLLTPWEHQHILIDWDATKVATTHRCIHQLFEEQAARQPAATALSFGEHKLRYDELNAQSNQLAHGLAQHGVQPRQPLPVMLGNGPQQIVALLGILKAGGHYVCLDPSFPAARLRAILTEINPPCMIVDVEFLDQHWEVVQHFQQQAQTHVLVMDAEPVEIEEEGFDGCIALSSFRSHPTTNPVMSVTLSDPVYIAYTSGSTGQPKGIIATHAIFCQFLEWVSQEFQIQPGARVGQWVALTFDPAYVDIFGTLCFGATLCQASDLTKRDPAAVVDWLRDEHITHVQIVPSFFRQVQRVALEHSSAAHPFPALQYITFVGEPLPVELVQSWQTRFPSWPKLVNMYGPTEAIAATYYVVEQTSPRQRSVPIGRAIGGRQILILDEQQQPCPIGVKGEIYIRSPYLTLGYLNQPERTEAVFMQNPVQPDTPEMIYRTGDLGRWLPDGTIEFFGRRDYQVKVRGIRVELEDIETALSQHERVRECAVVAHSYGENDDRLVAYVVASGDPSRQELRAFLRTMLPAYMVPPIFVFLYALPRTSSGKINRTALPRPEAGDAEAYTAYIAPRTEHEKLIAGIWQELLHIDKVGINDNFFDLGGHSLLATQMINKLREICAVELPLRTFLDAPTTADLAKVLDSKQATAQSNLDKMAQIMEQVAQLSDHEARALLNQKRTQSDKHK